MLYSYLIFSFIDTSTNEKIQIKLTNKVHN
jgi:hypothetical protein